ncbi:hypothetical protein PP713_08765 [Mycobacterium sp. CSUR Q5927]|nr:hypothetical protein [Mycobacterium sp. CSUR Q5927]
MATGYLPTMPDDDATAAAPADEPLATTELDPAATAAAGPLAYSEHTSSMPVVEYQPPRVRAVWIVVLVLVAAAGVAAAMFVLGRTTARQEPAAAVPPAPTSAPVSTTPSAAAVPPAPPPVAAPPPAAVPPPITVTAAPPPPAAVTSVPPLATPQARIAEPLICSLHNEYPQMQPVDLALSMVDRGIYRDYDEARLVVDLVLADGCHGI